MGNFHYHPSECLGAYFVETPQFKYFIQEKIYINTYIHIYVFYVCMYMYVCNIYIVGYIYLYISVSI